MTDTDGGVRILGTLGSADGFGVVRVEDRLDAGIEDVWSALTEPKRLARWYGDVEGELRAGGPLPRTPPCEWLGRDGPGGKSANRHGGSGSCPRSRTSRTRTRPR